MKTLKLQWLGWAAGLVLATSLASYRVAVAQEFHNPRIHHAIDALRDAERELNDSPSDFHGHKQDALDAVHHAIEELDRIKDW
ncbi:MAG TPA: hypothetical protein VL992_16770 [Tepidisphaeraceae bacterium]|nr:hypothetical protein [Tepidisphaeraceae bacterium]